MKPRIKKGDRVYWLHKPYAGKQFWFNASGFVLDLRETIVGGCVRKKVAKIYLDPNPYWDEIHRETTTISLDKLRRDE